VDEVVIHCLVDEVVIHCVSRKRKRKEEGKTKKSKIKWKKKNGIATKLAPSFAPESSVEDLETWSLYKQSAKLKLILCHETQ
jgi:hypothetical protein